MQIEFVTANEIKECINKGIQFIDLRDREAYEERHIKGALSMPFQEFDQSFYGLPKNKEYVLYCERGTSSMLAVKKMLRHGYKAKSLHGGVLAIQHMN